MVTKEMLEQLLLNGGLIAMINFPEYEIWEPFLPQMDIETRSDGVLVIRIKVEE